MDPFDRLPAELINHILRSTSDFVGIESLLSASPRVHAVVLDRPAQSFQNLVASNSIASAPAIQEIIHKVRLLHDPAFQVHTLGEYIQRTNNACGEHDSDGSGAGICQMIKFCAQIQRLACDCLSMMQQKFISAVSCSSGGNLPGSVRAQEAAKPFSWIEEARVHWALWHLKQYSDMYNYASRFGWPDSSIEGLKKYHTWHSVDSLSAELIFTIAAVLADLGLDPTYSYPHLGAHEESLHGAWMYSLTIPPPRFHSFDLGANTDVAIWPLPSKPPNDLVTEAWHLSPAYCGNAPDQMAMFKSWARFLSHRAINPDFTLHNIRPYRRLGVFVWDTWRMYSTGLMAWRNRQQIETPVGGLTEIQSVPLQEWHSRWLALVKNIP